MAKKKSKSQKELVADESVRIICAAQPGWYAVLPHIYPVESKKESYIEYAPVVAWGMMRDPEPPGYGEGLIGFVVAGDQVRRADCDGMFLGYVMASEKESKHEEFMQKMRTWRDQFPGADQLDEDLEDEAKMRRDS